MKKCAIHAFFLLSFGFCLPELVADSREQQDLNQKLMEYGELLRDDPVKAEQSIVALLPKLQNYPSLLVEANMKLMEYENRMNAYVRTEALILESKKILSQHQNPELEIDLVLARFLFELDRKQWQGLRDELKRAYDLALSLDDKERQALILSNLGALDKVEQDFQSALNNSKLAYELIKDRKSSYAFRKTANQLALLYLEGLNIRLDDAIQLFQDVIESTRAEKSSNRADLQVLTGNIGYAYLNKGDFVKAEETFQQAIQLARETQDLAGIAYGQIYLSSLAIKTEKWSESYAQASQALTYFQKYDVRSQIIRAYRNMIRALLEQQKFAEAEQNWQILQKYLTKQEDLENQVTFLEFKSRLAIHAKRWQEAFQALDELMRFEKKLQIQKNNTSNQFYSALYNIEKREQENQILGQKSQSQLLELEAEHKQSQSLTWILFTTVIIVGIFIFDFLRIKKRQMKIAELSKTIQKNTLQRFLPESLIEKILNGDSDWQKSPHYRTVGFLQVELCDFARAVDLLGPQRMARILNQFMGEVAEVINRESGVIERVGHGSLLGVFGAAFDASPEAQAQQLIGVAREIFRRLETINAQWKKTEGYAFGIRLGLHQGEALVGSLGEPPFYEYSVTGPHLNFVKQLCQKGNPGEILYSSALLPFVQGVTPAPTVGAFHDEVYTLPRAS